MKRLKSNWSVSKIDFTKSLSRMTKRKSRSDLSGQEGKPSEAQVYQNLNFSEGENLDSNANDKNKSLTRKGFLNKFRRSMSISAESASELTQSLGNKPTSMFYLTETVDIDADVSNDSGLPSSPIQRNNRVVRPQSPPPPVPLQIGKCTEKSCLNAMLVIIIYLYIYIFILILSSSFIYLFCFSSLEFLL